MTDTKLHEALKPLLERVLKGETVEIGIFQVHEDYLYKRTKDANGNPEFNRVLSLVYFDEEEDDSPSTEEFDGTVESFAAGLDAHDALSHVYEEEDGTVVLDVI